ncbi:methylenetetrahydrofolate reductase [NAD(P)H] [Pelagibius litoralis]|uniref:Methylenetetrahydrofolate reductase n=1 Tax=Pelagibius litoralis TaxID=374515 RepID=A0A967C1M9_9PROT|nr:methylenetetrahydrofolate reductase [NAD(P)H] [Pelagibius litoralis]NIA67501.1 methylenetetrahydrofolate reductase [NAD(P)H] [Pelagibius litoralis]
MAEAIDHTLHSQVRRKHGPATRPRFSFEYFPPASPLAEERFWRTLRALGSFDPDFVSVTYGAGGTTQDRTIHAVERILNETDLKPAAHLTCVGASRAQIDALAEHYWAAGVRRIVALRGDAPKDQPNFKPQADGYAFAADLVAGLRRVADFEISVAAYPEVHPEAKSAEADLDNLKRKLDAGATRAITQFFFDPDDFLRFLDRARAAGITAPIIPGILPIVNFKRTCEIAASCKASIPSWLPGLFEGLEDQADVRDPVAASVAADLCRYLAARGVEEFHFYTLNRADLTSAVCRLLLCDAAMQAEPERRQLLVAGAAQ